MRRRRQMILPSLAVLVLIVCRLVAGFHGYFANTQIRPVRLMDNAKAHLKFHRKVVLVDASAGQESSDDDNAFARSKKRNFRISDLGKARDWERIVDLYLKEKDDFNVVNISTMLFQLSSIKRLNYQDERVEACLSDVARWIEDFGINNILGRDLNSIRKSLQAMDLPPRASKTLQSIERFFRAKDVNAQLTALGAKNDWNGILDTFQKERQHFNAVNYSTAMSQLSRIQSFRKDDPRLEDLVSEIGIKLQDPSLSREWSPRELANVFHALAKIQLRRSRGAIAIVKAFQRDDLIDEIVDSGTPHAISNTVWAFATMGIPCQRLLTRIESRASYLVNNGNAQDYSNTMWAAAKLGVLCPALFKEVDTKASILVESGRPQATSNTVWAYATLGIPCPSLLKEIDARHSIIVENGTPQNIANTVWAFATLGVTSPSLLQAIDARAAYVVENGSTQAIANTALAFAKLGYDSKMLFNCIEKRADWLSERALDQEICNICYAIAILDLATTHEAGFHCLWKRATAIDYSNLQREACLQILQTFVMVSRVIKVPAPNELLKATEEMIEGDISESRTQREVSEVLHQLGVLHDTEASPFPNHAFVLGVLAIDAACKKERIAIEFDGPTHFLLDAHTGEVVGENGPTKAKRRFLERLGWKVVNISYLEWDCLTSVSEKKALLARRLKNAIIEMRATQ